MSGFSGGQYMAVAAVPGMLVIGPAFHMYKEVAGGSNVAAVALTSISESAIFYGAETKNAQLAFNADAAQKGLKPIAKVQSQFNPIGGGLGLHIARNYLAMSGLRVLSSPCQDVLSMVNPSMPTLTRNVLGDFIANVVVSAMSAPLHQLYGFQVTQRVADVAAGSQTSMAESMKSFLKKQYLTPAGRISSVAARDVFLRVAYNATIFTVYGAIERAFVDHFPLKTWGF